MRRTYHTIEKNGKANVRRLGEFLSKHGQLLLPTVDLIEQGRLACDELIDVAGRATPQAVLELSAQQVAGGPVGRQNRVRLKLNQIPPIPQLRATVPRSLVPVLFPMISVWRSKFERDQTVNGFAEKFFQAALRHVYRWCSPPTRGMPTTSQ